MMGTQWCQEQQRCFGGVKLWVLPLPSSAAQCHHQSQHLDEPEVMTTCGEKPPEMTAELIANLWLLHKWRTFVMNNEYPKLWGELSPGLTVMQKQ